MPTLKKPSITLAEAREAARFVKAARKSKQPAKAARGSKLWERYLGHFGDRENPSRKKAAPQKIAAGASKSSNGSERRTAKASVTKTTTRKRSAKKSTGRRAS